MKDDIVARLRRLLGKCQTAPAMTVWSRDLREAADEIERLREELRKYTGDGHVPIEPFTPEAL